MWKGWTGGGPALRGSMGGVGKHNPSSEKTSICSPPLSAPALCLLEHPLLEESICRASLFWSPCLPSSLSIFKNVFVVCLFGGHLCATIRGQSNACAAFGVDGCGPCQVPATLLLPISLSSQEVGRYKLA